MGLSNLLKPNPKVTAGGNPVIKEPGPVARAFARRGGAVCAVCSKPIVGSGRKGNLHTKRANRAANAHY